MEKNPPANTGDTGSIPGSGRSPGEGNGNPLQYFCLGNPMDRGLVGYSPWGYKRVRHDSAIEQQKEHWKRVRLPMALSVTNPQQFVDHRK